VSREVRRVPLDFDAPLDTVWAGYVMPDHLTQTPCPTCVDGATAASKWLETFCRRLWMLAEDAIAQERGKPMHPYLTNDPCPVTTRGAYNAATHTWTEWPQLIRPSADILPLIGGLVGETPDYFRGIIPGDHSYKMLMKIVEAAGLDPDTWGICTTCNGEARLDAYEGQSDDIEAWQPTEPPTGDGWQLWNTAGDPMPISPVCSTADDLAAWMSHPDRGNRWVPQPTAARFIAAGWAPTAAGTPDTGIVSGVEWVGHHAAKED
jgi:hypothetical protein